MSMSISFLIHTFPSLYIYIYQRVILPEVNRGLVLYKNSYRLCCIIIEMSSLQQNNNNKRGKKWFHFCEFLVKPKSALTVHTMSNK